MQSCNVQYKKSYKSLYQIFHLNKFRMVCMVSLKYVIIKLKIITAFIVGILSISKKERQFLLRKTTFLSKISEKFFNLILFPVLDILILNSDLDFTGNFIQ